MSTCNEAGTFDAAVVAIYLESAEQPKAIEQAAIKVARYDRNQRKTAVSITAIVEAISRQVHVANAPATRDSEINIKTCLLSLTASQFAPPMLDLHGLHAPALGDGLRALHLGVSPCEGPRDSSRGDLATCPHRDTDVSFQAAEV